MEIALAVPSSQDGGEGDAITVSANPAVPNTLSSSTSPSGPPEKEANHHPSGKYDKDDEEEHVCQICRNPGDNDNPLRCACACKGSIKFAHQDLLLQWPNHSNARQCEVMDPLVDQDRHLLSPGPRDTSVLDAQLKHRSTAIWDGRESSVLDLRTGQHLMRDLTRTPRDARVVDHLVRAGVYGFYRLGCIQLYRPLITALVERWRVETHTFHMPIGECTITLEDISAITGLPVDGMAVTGVDMTNRLHVWPDIVQGHLGVAPSTDAIKGNAIKFSWLLQHFGHLPVDADDDDVRRHARATIFMLIGGCLFPNKSRNLIPMMYLPLLDDLDRVGQYSWGGAALAYLYREMCRASQVRAKEMAGPLVILQIWAWERFAVFRPIVRHRGRQADAPQHEEPDVAQPDAPDVAQSADPLAVAPLVAGPVPLVRPTDPYGCRWHGGLTLTSSRTLVEYRDQLDLMVEPQMTWQPYPPDLDVPTHDREIWRTRSPLICFDIVEMHLPDRVMRQFGMIQHEPPICDTSLGLHAIDRRGRVGTDWSIMHADHIAAWNDRRARVVTSDTFTGRMDRSDPYMQWYELITRHPIGPPCHVPPVGSQPIAATREILVQTAVMATQIAAELLTCTNMEEVHRLATRLRMLGRRSVVALNEEYRIGGDISRSRSDRVGPSNLASDGPSSLAGAAPRVGVGVGAGPSTLAPPSVLTEDGPSTFIGVSPSTPPSAPTDLPSIDNYTAIIEDAEALPSHDLQFVTPTLPPTRLGRPSPMYVKRKRTRSRY